MASGDVDGDDGSVITWKCLDDDYVLQGEATATCHDGRWSSDRPSCVPGEAVCQVRLSAR